MWDRFLQAEGVRLFGRNKAIHCSTATLHVATKGEGEMVLEHGAAYLHSWAGIGGRTRVMPTGSYNSSSPKQAKYTVAYIESCFTPYGKTSFPQTLELLLLLVQDKL